MALAGLLATRRRPVAGALLFAAGLAGAALADAAMRAKATGQAQPATYDPVDMPKPLADDIWVVDSGPLHGITPLRMTVIRLPDGGLLLHSPTTSAATLRAELDRIGPVRALLAPNPAHWMFVPEWQRTYPQAVTWAAPGLRDRSQVKKAGMRIDHDLPGGAPTEWTGTLDLVPVPGALGFTEIAVFHRPSRTLVLTDLVLNLEPQRLPALLRPLVRLLGSMAPRGRAPAHVRTIMRAGGEAAQQAAARLVQLRPERLVFAHGRLFDGDADGGIADIPILAATKGGNTMNPITLARLLGWFSFSIGALEIAAPSALSRNLGLPGGAALVRGYGLREMIAGFAIMGKPWSSTGPWSRVAGDTMDLATLAMALGPDNRRRGSAAVATVLVAGITALDIICAVSLTRGNARALQTAKRSRVA